MKTLQRKRNQPEVRKSERRSTIIRLNVPLSVKAESIDASARTFEGLAATWDEDLGSDIIHKGAFKSSILEWKASNEAMPLLNSHDHYDIFSALGQAVAMKETSDGLWTKWEVLAGPDGDAVLARLRPSPTTGRAIIGKMSIGFVPTKYEYEQPEGTESMWDRKRHISEASLKEVSLVLFPMNPHASINAQTVKMWIKMAHDTDPHKLDSLARHELRRLNSKIGLLLSKGRQRTEDDEEEEQIVPPTATRKASAPSGRKTESDPSVDDEDDTLDEQDDVVDDDTPDEDTDPDEGTEDGEATPSDTKGKAKAAPKQEEDDAPATYEYTEALAQRLKRVTLKARTDEAKTRLPSQ